MTTPQQPGWYDDPGDAKAQRYWDGQVWTPQRRRKPMSSANQQPATPPALSAPPSPAPSPYSGSPPPSQANQPPPLVQQPSYPQAGQQYGGPGQTTTQQSPEPGWWQASDGNWYPPNPATGPQASGPGYGAAPGYGATPGYGGAPGYGAAPGAGSSTQVIGVGPAFSYGLAKFQAHAREILFAGFICLVGYLVLLALVFSIEVFGMFGSLETKGGIGLFLIAIPIMLIIPFVGLWLMQMVIIRGSLMIVNGQTPLTLGRMFSLDRIGPFALGAVLVSVLACIGFVFCYIPGLIFLFFAGYWAYFLIGKQLSPIDAIRSSFSLVWANFGTQLVFAFASFLVIWLGSLCYFGLIVALPVVVIAQGYMWRRMQGEPVAP
jgi:hypothetical protein